MKSLNNVLGRIRERRRRNLPDCVRGCDSSSAEAALMNSNKQVTFSESPPRLMTSKYIYSSIEDLEDEPPGPQKLVSYKDDLDMFCDQKNYGKANNETCVLKTITTNGANVHAGIKEQQKQLKQTRV